MHLRHTFFHHHQFFLSKIPAQYYEIIIGSIIFIIILIIMSVLCYKKYRTYRDYNDSPQIFAHKPSLTLIQNYHLTNCQFQSLYSKNNNLVTSKQLTEGLIFQANFDNEMQGVYYNNILENDAYFEVQILKLNSNIEIGFINSEDLEKLKEGESLSRLGISISTTGHIQLAGESLSPYNWALNYGDTLGAAITKEGTNKRVWITLNGQIMNPPSPQEIDKWIAEANLTENDQQNYNKQTEKHKKEQEQDQKSNEQKAIALKKKKICIKNVKKFKYYAVVTSTNVGQNTKNSKVNINIGAQVFRMHAEESLRGGLLD